VVTAQKMHAFINVVRYSANICHKRTETTIGLHCHYYMYLSVRFYPIMFPCKVIIAYQMSIIVSTL